MKMKMKKVEKWNKKNVKLESCKNRRQIIVKCEEIESGFPDCLWRFYCPWYCVVPVLRAAERDRICELE